MEKHILFSGEMVKSILNGRKTQTRRVIAKTQTASLPWRLFPKRKQLRPANDNPEPIRTNYLPGMRAGTKRRSPGDFALEYLRPHLRTLRIHHHGERLGDG